MPELIEFNQYCDKREFIVLLKEIISKIQRKAKSTALKRKLLAASENLEKPRSAIFYTTHKCASTFVRTLFNVLLEDSAYELINYAGLIYQLGDQLNLVGDYELFLQNAYSELYFSHGKVYAPQRKYLDFPGRNQFKHIFFLRDPRDVLVSAYYSFGFIHELPRNSTAKINFQEERAKIQDQGIDDFVLEQAKEWIIPQYQEYKQLQETAESHLYLTYDFFVGDTPNFIEKIVDYLELAPSQEKIELLTKKANPVQNQETMKHKRSGKTGQYLEKLKPNTITELNNLLSKTLVDWQFEVGK